MCPLLREQTDVRIPPRAETGRPHATQIAICSKRAAHTIRLLVAWLVLKVRLLYLFFGLP